MSAVTAVPIEAAYRVDLIRDAFVLAGLLKMGESLTPNDLSLGQLVIADLLSPWSVAQRIMSIGKGTQ
jgi:hypothetical protein